MNTILNFVFGLFLKRDVFKGIIIFLMISYADFTIGVFVATANQVSEKDTVVKNPDRHPLISIGSGCYNPDKLEHANQWGIMVMIGLEYPLDRNRDWNIELIHYHLYQNKSGLAYNSGLLSFRRYLFSQEYDIRPSIHIGLGSQSIDVGGGIDITLVKRLFYSQLCVRYPISFVLVHANSGEMPLLITLNTRIML